MHSYECIFSVKRYNTELHHLVNAIVHILNRWIKDMLTIYMWMLSRKREKKHSAPFKTKIKNEPRCSKKKLLCSHGFQQKKVKQNNTHTHSYKNKHTHTWTLSFHAMSYFAMKTE